MKIQINGKEENVQDGFSVKSLLESKQINPNVVACELNLQVLRRAQLESIILKEGDRLEIIRMIGGG